MKNHTTNDLLVIKKEQQTTSPSTRLSPYSRVKAQRESKIQQMITAHLTNLPTFVEGLDSSELILDLSAEVKEKLKNGEIKFGTYSKSGKEYAQLIDSKTNNIYQNIPIKELPTNLGPAIAMAGITAKLEAIEETLAELGDKLDRVNRNFDLNRYAEVNSAQEKFNMALLATNSNLRQTLFSAALDQSTTAKNLLLNQLLEFKMTLTDNKLKRKVAEDQATTALEHLDFFKEAFKIQSSVLFELGEFEILSQTLYDFNETISQHFSEAVSLELDSHLAITSNPFKHFSQDLLQATQETILYIDNHSNLLTTGVQTNLLKESSQ